MSFLTELLYKKNELNKNLSVYLSYNILSTQNEENVSFSFLSEID